MWYDLVQNNNISPIVGVPNSRDHHDHFFQLFIMAFMVSVKWNMKYNIVGFQ